MTNITKILFIFHIEIYSDSKQQHQFTKQPLKGVISYGNNRERKKKISFKFPNLPSFYLDSQRFNDLRGSYTVV